MQRIDWIIMFAPLLVVAVIGAYTRRYVRSVADFMAGGRNAGRYLLCTARSGMGGAVTFVAGYEIFFRSGFFLKWWDQVGAIVGLFLTIYAFVIYRYRKTRVLTLAQFFEMRYSRNFRIFCGGLGFLAGLINYGLIPVIAARFFVYFLELPLTVHLLGHDVPTFQIVMGLFLTCSTMLVTLGGQVTVLATDCTEGMFNLAASVVIVAALMSLKIFNWSETRDVLLNSVPGKSLINPFDASGLEDFNIWYVLMGLVTGTYATMAWQNAHAFNSCALTPHEARMGGILGRYRGFIGGVSALLLQLIVFTYLRHPHHTAGALGVDHLIAKIHDKETQNQMRGPVALTQLLPAGLRGLLCSTLLMGVLSTDGMHLHSWSSILVQDVIVPLRKRPFSIHRHLLLLRLGMVGVAIFAFTFGSLFRQTELVQMWFSITQAIFTGGAGAAIIGGLYWSRGTTAAAWIGMITGSTLSLLGILIRQPFWNELQVTPHTAFFVHHLGRQFHLNGVEMSFSVTLIAMSTYIVVSLLTCKTPHNMDRLLHRGTYADPNDTVIAATRIKRFDLIKIVGINAEFTRGDRWLTLGTFGWQMAWFAVFLIGTTVNLIHPFSRSNWAGFWLWSTIWIPLAIGVVTTVWFLIGCTHDMQIFFQRLRAERVNPQDDGTVTHTPSGAAVSHTEETFRPSTSDGQRPAQVLN